MQIQDWLGAKGFAGDFVADGQIHRARRHNHHNKSAWYVAWVDPCNICVAGDWRTGEKWEFRDKRDLTRKEERAVKNQIAQAVADAERERLQLQDRAALRADIEIRSAEEPEGHPYLIRKGVESSGAVANRDGELLIPMHDVHGKLWGLQRILADGRKFFLPGQRVSGTFHRIGEFAASGVAYICEGFATGASIHAATRCPVFCAFSAGNLESVAASIKKKYPQLDVVIAGDNDLYTEGNPGKSAAESVARVLRLRFRVPEFFLEGKLTDFNDLAISSGLEEVGRQLGDPQQAPAMTEASSKKYYSLMRS